jgi:uncharacterized membrane protein YhhN
MRARHVVDRTHPDEARVATLCLIAALVCAGIDWIAVAQERRGLEYLAKPATLGLLLLYAALGAHVSWFLIAALTLSLLGDVYLMLPDELFPAGLGAFLLAHLAYVAGFDATLLARCIWFVVVAAASLPLALRIIRAVPETPLRIGIGVYMAAISLMVASAIGSGLLAAIVGALLFFVSDALIALNRFVTPFASARLAVIVTYHLGQLLLVVALR